MAQVNYLAVLVASIAATVVGFLWYSPMLFGKLWMQLSGLTEKKLEESKKKRMAKAYIFTFLATIVKGYVLVVFLKYASASTIAQGLMIGFWLWLGFIATTTLGSIFWEGKSVKLYILNNAHELITLLVMSIILTVWV